MISAGGRGGKVFDIQIQLHPDGHHFFVKGGSTFAYKENLKSINPTPTWDKSFKAWRFVNSARPQVEALIENLRAGNVAATPVQKDNRFQYLKYKAIPRPESGMRVKITIKKNGVVVQEMWSIVSLTQNTGPNVDSMFITPDGTPPAQPGAIDPNYLKAVIICGRWQLLPIQRVNGVWQLLGIHELEHDIHFELGNAPGTTGTSFPGPTGTSFPGPQSQ